MDKFKEIRPVALGVVRRGNKILVSEGYDKVKEEVFYRCIGGGIEFKEESKEALKREFKEEIGIDISVGKFLGIFENIFVFNGHDAHELILFYEINIKDEDYKENYKILDEKGEPDATWIDIDKFKKDELKIYPKEMLEYLD